MRYDINGLELVIFASQTGSWMKFSKLNNKDTGFSEQLSGSELLPGLRYHNLYSAFLLCVFFLIFTAGCSMVHRFPGFEKRKMLSVFHLLETKKFTDAKDLLEELMEDEDAVRWSRLWYARGILCQDAYQEGKSKNDKKLMTLYPDQLYEAWNAFEMSIVLDREGRSDRSLAARYILMANEFQQLGHQHYKAGRYVEALRAFDQVVTIAEGTVLAGRADSTLIYNTAVAAYGAKSWQDAHKYLQRLHKMQYKANATHLLAFVHLKMEDTLSAITVLAEGIDHHNYSEALVILFADLHTRRGDTGVAIEVLTSAAKADTANYRFPYSIGLIHQQAGDYLQAITAYQAAHQLFPEETEILVLIATCYYNQGVMTEERTRFLSSKSQVLTQRNQSAESFRKARMWLEKAIALQTDDPQLLLRIRELNQALRVPSKGDSLMPGG
jgi:tetratricopeptide (TPR) repeat protein